MRPVYLDGTEPVFGLFHPPEGEPSGVGVLLVPPFGWDDQSAYRPRRAWAAALAGDGHAALRIDLPGTGDSGGTPRDPDRLGAWTNAIEESARWLHEPAGARRVAVVGMGLGGLLSLRAIAAGAAVDGLVLWGAASRGRALLRELKAFGRLEASQTGEEPGEAPAGELRAGGHVLSAETASALAGLEAAALLRGGSPRRALLLGRDGVGPDGVLHAALVQAGADVATDPGHGWGDAIAGPQHARAPHEVFALVSAWLADAGPPPAPLARASPPAAATPASTEIAVGDGRVRETVLRIQTGDTELFGVLAEPVGGAAGAAGTAVLLNAGAVRHIGPNRMWTEAARRWAAAGTPSLRLDVEGVGEADGDAAAYEDVAALYVPALTNQVLHALDALEARGMPPRYFCAGLCSGGFWAFHGALADERIRSALMLNPQLFHWDADAGPQRELRRALSVLTPDGFKALLRADRPFARLLEIVRWMLAASVRRLRRGAGAGDGHPPAREPVDAAVRRLRSRGQRLELAFSGNEMLLDELASEGRVAALEAAGVRFHAIPYRSHTLKPLGAQAAAHAILDGALERAFAQDQAQ